MSNSDLLLNDTVDTLANGAVVGAFIGGALALLLRRDDVQIYVAKGGVIGGFGGLGVALAKAVSS
jgi:hypothetical protein